MNPWMILYQTINYVDSCYGCVCSPLTWETKDIVGVDDHDLTMTYEALAASSLKLHKLDTTWSPRRWLNGRDGIIRLRYKRG